MDKWFALPAATPDAYVKAYRAAFAAASNDPEFAEKGTKVSEDFEPMSHDDVTLLMESSGNTPGPAIDFIASMLEKQGLKTE